MEVAYARAQAKRLCRELQVCRLPIRLSEICQQLNIALHEVDLGDRDAFIITSDALGRSIIQYSRRNQVPRKRFSIAHEVAHFYLGHTGIAFLSGQDSYEEREANAFASELLMPEAFMLHLWSRGDMRPFVVAGVFNVSWQAADIRVREVYESHRGLLDNDEEYISGLKKEYDLSSWMQGAGFVWEGYYG